LLVDCRWCDTEHLHDANDHLKNNGPQLLDVSISALTLAGISTGRSGQTLAKRRCQRWVKKRLV
jgi:hypothetical protein